MAYSNYMNLDNHKDLLNSMRLFSLEHMLLQDCMDSDLEAICLLSAHLSPRGEPTRWITELLKVRKQNPALPRAPWDSPRCVIREYWYNCYAQRKQDLTWSWSNSYPFIIGVAVGCPLIRVYLFNLMGMKTSYAKAQIESTFNGVEQSIAFDAATRLLARMSPKGSEKVVDPLEIGRTSK
jgi:hypothetical protein